MKSDACAIIVGGTGFIGSFFARYLLEQAGFAKVYLLDVDAPAQKSSVYRQKMLATTTSASRSTGGLRKRSA